MNNKNELLAGLRDLIAAQLEAERLGYDGDEGPNTSKLFETGIAIDDYITEHAPDLIDALSAPEAQPAMTDNSSANLFTFWWSLVEADAQLLDEPIKDDAVILHFMGSGASCIVTAKDIRNVCRLLAGSDPKPQEQVQLAEPLAEPDTSAEGDK